jgi:hypothetical protein
MSQYVALYTLNGISGIVTKFWKEKHWTSSSDAIPCVFVFEVWSEWLISRDCVLAVDMHLAYYGCSST